MKPTNRKFRVAILTNLFASITMGFFAYVAIKYGNVPSEDVKSIITTLAERYAYMVGIVSIGFFGIQGMMDKKRGENEKVSDVVSSK